MLTWHALVDCAEILVKRDRGAGLERQRTLQVSHDEVSKVANYRAKLVSKEESTNGSSQEDSVVCKFTLKKQAIAM